MKSSTVALITALIVFGVQIAALLALAAFATPASHAVEQFWALYWPIHSLVRAYAPDNWFFLGNFPLAFGVIVVGILTYTLAAAVIAGLTHRWLRRRRIAASSVQ